MGAVVKLGNIIAIDALDVKRDIASGCGRQSVEVMISPDVLGALDALRGPLKARGRRKKSKGYRKHVRKMKSESRS